jgi:hypothetical protein
VPLQLISSGPAAKTIGQQCDPLKEDPLMATSKKLVTLAIVAMAVFAVGCSDDSPVAPTTPDNAPPAVPSELSAAYTGSQAIISWAPNTVDPDLAGYTVTRSNRGETETLVENALITSYADPAPKNGTSVYQVTAVDRAGNHSAVASVTLDIVRGHRTGELKN